MNKPKVMIGAAMTRFDAEGHPTDAGTRTFVAAQVAAVKAWAPRLRG